VKILIVTFTFPPEVGGVAEVARTQAIGFSRRGHDVTVATSFDPRRTDAHAPDAVKVRQFSVTGSFDLGSSYHGEVETYRKFIVEADFDVILLHCWQNWMVDVAIPVLPRISPRKVLISHGFDAQVWKPQSRFPWGLGTWLRSLPYASRLPGMMSVFDRVVFLSDRSDAGRFFDRWVAKRFCAHRAAVIPNGVHLSEFDKHPSDFRKSYGIETKFMLLNVANYDDRKNQLATLSDFMALNRADATLVFIGGEFNEYQATLVRAQAVLKLKNPQAQVLMLEKVPKAAIYAAYQAADVFLLGAKHETQPLAILDAMAARVPFVSTNAGCVGEFPGGIVVPTGPETTRSIQDLLDNSALRKRLGQEGRKACETKYDWERVLDAYEALLTRMLKPRT